MTEVIMLKKGHAFWPTDEEGVIALRLMPDGAMVKVKFSVPRNIRQFRLFHALIRVCYEHQREPKYFATERALRGAILCQAGHGDQVKFPDGTVHMQPRDIGFGAIDQVEFRQVFESCKNVILNEILPRVNSRDLDRQVADMLREPNPYER